MNTFFHSVLLIASITCTALFYHFHHEVKSLKKNARNQLQFAASIENGLLEASPLLGSLSLPIELQNVPTAEKKGIVLGSKEIEVRDVVAPYNPSLVKTENGYLMFFRYDVIEQNSPTGFYTYIGCAELDQNFKQTEKEYTVIDTGSKFSEDPRIVKVGEELFLFFNDLNPHGQINGRTMRVGKVNLAESKLDFKSNLDLNFQHIEKNWVPFEFIGEDGKANLYVEYYMNPHKLLHVTNPELDNVIHLSFPEISASQRLFWPSIWGSPRGGSAAQKIGDQYLSFFHSTFKDRNGYHWYLMGAYTFEAKAPFRVTAISHYPILFEGIYNSPLMNTAPANKRVIFPAGFSVETKNGKRLIHVACGENDCAIKIVTIDEAKLLKNLKKI